jgi:hypothetical protein
MLNSAQVRTGHSPEFFYDTQSLTSFRWYSLRYFWRSWFQCQGPRDRNGEFRSSRQRSCSWGIAQPSCCHVDRLHHFSCAHYTTSCAELLHAHEIQVLPSILRIRNVDIVQIARLQRLCAHSYDLHVSCCRRRIRGSSSVRRSSGEFFGSTKCLPVPR